MNWGRGSAAGAADGDDAAAFACVAVADAGTDVRGDDVYGTGAGGAGCVVYGVIDGKSITSSRPSFRRRLSNTTFRFFERLLIGKETVSEHFSSDRLTLTELWRKQTKFQDSSKQFIVGQDRLPSTRRPTARSTSLPR